ncbi:LysR family transcriptional regulator [Motiliproteus sp.]|uniref:LysR family transcriptional regulator n=1 Tax=Motiliproteus sp. TaxID=1898955 RepID=UPI003BAC802C
MDKRQLQIFQTVARCGGFTKASKSLHMAQPAVSIAIKKLEQEFGLMLFDRSEKQIELTAEGRVLLDHADRILDQFHQAGMAMSELSGVVGGEVRLLTSAMLGSYLLPEQLASFRRDFPRVRVRVSSEGTQRAAEMIEAGEAELGVLHLDKVSPTLEARPFAREEVVVCVATDDPLARYPSITFEQFVQRDLVVYEPGYYLRELLEQTSREEGHPLRIGLETNLLRLMLSLVRQGSGISICLRHVLEHESGLVALSFEEPVYLNLGIGWHRKRYLSRAGRALLEHLCGDLEDSPLDD